MKPSLISTVALIALIYPSISHSQWTQVNTGLIDTSLHKDDLIIVSLGTDCVSIHSGPSLTDSVKECEPAGYAGQILTGPVTDQNGSSSLMFYEVRFQDNWGWCASKYLHKTNLQIPAIYSLVASGETLFTGIPNGVYRSTDYGETWSLSGLAHIQVNALAVSGSNIFAGIYGGVYRSTDNGTSWAASGLTDSNIVSFAVSRTCLFARTSGDSLFRSTDNGASWGRVTCPNTIALVDTNLFAQDYYGRINLSTDNGTTWKQVWKKLGPFEESWNFCSSGNYLLYMDNGGDPWDCVFRLLWASDSLSWATNMNFPPSYLSCSYWIGYVQSFGSTVCLSYGGDYLTTNSGSNWKIVNWPSGISSSGNPVPGAIVTLGGNLFVGGSGGSGVWRSSISSALPIQLASFNAKTTNGRDVSLTWTTASETNNYGFSVQRDAADIAFIAGHGTALASHAYSFTDCPPPGQYRYRLKQTDLDGSFTYSEDIAVVVSAPEKFALAKNYPNPFNPTTRISFSLAKDGPVSLRVYDVLGRQVITLVNESRKAGTYTEAFDGSNAASGAYLYVLRSSEGQLVGRMMLVK